MALTRGDLEQRLAQEAVSSWVLVDQPMIDRFADATGDHQFIHVDPERAAHTPFGGTIAHGFLIQSLLPRLRDEARPDATDGARMEVNYGTNKLRSLREGGPRPVQDCGNPRETTWAVPGHNRSNHRDRRGNKAGINL